MPKSLRNFAALLFFLIACPIGLVVMVFPVAAFLSSAHHTRTYDPYTLDLHHKHEVYANGQAKRHETLAMIHEGALKVAFHIRKPSQKKGGAHHDHHAAHKGPTIWVKHSVWRFWWKNGTRKAEQRYFYGRFHGVQRTWYSNGKLRTETPYTFGFKHGTAKAWYSDGTPRTKKDFVYGQAQGNHQEWWSNGQLSAQGRYQDGKRTGKWFHYYSNGQLRSSANYLDGQKHGKWRAWWSVCRPSGCNHVLAEEGIYSQGKKTQRWKTHIPPLSL